MKTSTILIAALALLPFTAAAQGAFVEGTHYHRIDQARDSADAGKVEVVYVFWYGCPSCYTLEPLFKRWQENVPDDVEVTKIAASMNPSWRVHARAYYTAELLDILDDVHDEIFRAIHVERRQLSDTDAMARLFVQHGVDEEQFRRTFSGFAVESRMRRGDQFTRRYRLSGVPAIVVNGKYRTDANRAGGHDRLVQLIDYLVEKERQAGAPAG